MKKYMPNPHFLLISFFVLIMISSGPSIKAQDNKEAERTIIITQGDTIVNGKKLSDASPKERSELRKEVQDMKRVRGSRSLSRGQGDQKEVIIRRGETPHILHWNDGEARGFNFRNGGDRDVNVFKFDGDSPMLSLRADTLMKNFSLDSNLRKRIITMHRDMNFDSPDIRVRALPRTFMERSEFPGFRRNNSSNFNYSYTDKDGISNRMNISISDAEKEKIQKITGAESISKPLDVTDITIFPNFSSGKAGLSFNLNTRGTTRVKVLDSDLKEVFTDEASNFTGNYMKQISLPRNGIYYIAISQNGSWYVKKMIKD